MIYLVPAVPACGVAVLLLMQRFESWLDADDALASAAGTDDLVTGSAAGA